MAYKRSELEKLSTSALENALTKRKNDSARAKVTQMGLKVFLNSEYGMLGNQYSRYYDVRIAEAITLSGQLSIQWIKRRINKYLNDFLQTDNIDYIIAGDTDSIYITLKPFVDKITYGKDVDKQKIVRAVDKFCDLNLQPEIDQAYTDLAKYVNAFEQKMAMSREVIADRGVWRAKKNYALNVYNSEGVSYDPPKLKIMGMESVRSSTPEVCRDGFKEAVRIILQEDQAALLSHVSTFKNSFMELPIEDISAASGINDIGKWHTDSAQFVSGTPYHVKAAMVYNRWLDRAGVSDKYRHIKDGDKIKLIALKKANPTHNNLIAFPDILPPEFQLDEYIDRHTQYTKKFLSPVKSITDLVGWQAEKRGTLF